MISDDEPAAQLEIDPDSFLTFELHRPAQGSASSDASKCTMTLRHPGGTNNCFAFKVKTTQPRRYLVRPNQGIIAPNKSETVSILLVAKDKQSLLQSYDRLGASALEHSKDKFLVQSCIVSQDFSDQFMYSNEKNKDLSDALTSMWNNPSNSSNVALQNKKLHVKHVVVDQPNSAKSAPAPPMSTTSHLPISSADNSSLVAEITSLRKKYDELVAFSVSLTAERDVLNNTLEQTKRELNIEKSARTRLEGAVNSPPSQKGMSLGTLLAILVACIAAFIMGLKYGVNGENDLTKIPLLTKFL